MASVQLEWQQAPGSQCANEASVRRLVSEALGQTPFAANADQVLSVTVAGTGVSLRASLRLNDADGALLGERHLVGGDCEELGRAIALAVVLALDPAPEAPKPPKKPLPVKKDRPERPKPVAESQAAPVAHGSALDPAHWVLAVDLGAGLGALASTSGQLGAQLRRDFGDYAVGLGGKYALTETQVAAGQLTQSLVEGRALVCLELGTFDGCGFADLGMISASTTGFASNGTNRSAHGAGGLRAEWATPLAGTLNLGIYGEGAVRFGKITLRADETVLWDSSRVLGEAGLLLRWAL